MDVLAIVITLAGLILWLWITVLGVIAAKYDRTLDSFQKKAQIIISIVIPIFGPALVLYLVNQHSPEVIPKAMVPWPLRKLVFGHVYPRNPHRDENQGPAEDLALSQRFGSPHDFESEGGGSDGGENGD
jgi:hypothetical protein